VSGGEPAEPAARIDPAASLLALTERLQAGNPDLYRHLALYLQVLRQVLPGRVERACFHLATQLQPRRYVAIPEQDRLQLHRRIHSLVQRCASLLTVEQLCTLAAQMARERHRQERRQRQELLQRFAAAVPLTAPGDARGTDPDETTLPEGSVQLGMALPLSIHPFVGGGAWVDKTSVPSHPEAREVLAAAELEGEVGDLGASGDSTGWNRSVPWSEGQLPQDPITLLDWLDGLEQALERRLRNLSHAINVELLRHGLSGTLLPVALLDAVLNGQLEPQPAPANLLRLQLPFAAEAAEGPLQALAVLLRSADLELEEPRLRTCRRRLQQHRQEVRRMAQQYRRLLRWCEAHQSEQLWLQDLKASRNLPT
jgi:hypothetical protein